MHSFSQNSILLFGPAKKNKIGKSKLESKIGGYSSESGNKAKEKKTTQSKKNFKAIKVKI